MAKRRKDRTSLSPELDVIVRVTPEMTERAKSKLIQKITPPEESNAKKKTKRQLYCPYCAQYRVFKAKQMNGYLTYKRCTGCGISNNDYYVRYYNKLFNKTI